MTPKGRSLLRNVARFALQLMGEYILCCSCQVCHSRIFRIRFAPLVEGADRASGALTHLGAPRSAQRIEAGRQEEGHAAQVRNAGNDARRHAIEGEKTSTRRPVARHIAARQRPES